jgi:hypothetical protein
MSTSYGSENEASSQALRKSPAVVKEVKSCRRLVAIGSILMVACTAGAYSSMRWSQSSLRIQNMESMPLDKNNSSYLPSNELTAALASPSSENSSDIFNAIDQNHDGVVAIDEILRFYQDQKKASVKKIQEGEIAAGLSIDRHYEAQSQCAAAAYDKVNQNLTQVKHGANDL